MKKININELYLLVVSTVSFVNNRKRIVFDKTKRQMRVAIKKNDEYYDVLTKIKYYSFRNNNYYEIRQHMDDYFFCEITNLSMFLKNKDSKYITIGEIEKCINTLNGIEEQKSGKDEDKINDPVLQLILLTRAKVHERKMNDDKYLYYDDKLKECGFNYVDTLKIIKENQDTYYSFRLLLIKKVCDELSKIELELLDYPKIDEQMDNDLEIFEKKFTK